MPSTTPISDDIISEDIYLRWAVRADIPAMTKIIHTFFLDFEFHDHCCPRRKEKPEEYYLFLLQRIQMCFVRKGSRFMVAERLAVTSTGEQREILGFTGWDPQGENNPIRKEWMRQDESWTRALERNLNYLDGLNQRYLVNTVFNYAAFEKLWRRLDESHAHVEDLKNNLHLQFLFVAPQWQRGYGVGRRLLQFGIDVAEQTGLPITIEASLAGYPFYLKMGCELFAMVRIDIVAEKAYDMPVVVYWPKRRGLES